jgi:hypothetical protein
MAAAAATAPSPPRTITAAARACGRRPLPKAAARCGFVKRTDRDEIRARAASTPGAIRAAGGDGQDSIRGVPGRHLSHL